MQCLSTLFGLRTCRWSNIVIWVACTPVTWHRNNVTVWKFPFMGFSCQYHTRQTGSHFGSMRRLEANYFEWSCYERNV